MITPSLEWLKGSKYNPQGCGECKNFPVCKEIKGCKSTTDYCQLSFNGFTPREK